MKTGLTFGKWGLIIVVWIFILLTLNDSIDVMAIIQFSKYLLYAITLVTVGFAAFNFIENPKTGIKFIVSTLILVVVFFISYVISEDSIDPETKEIISGSKATEAGIYTLIVGLFGAVAAIVGSSIKSILKV